MHRGQRLCNPRGCLRVLDGVAQVVEHVALDVEVRLEVGVGQYLLDPVMEPVGLHELVVEVERDCETIGYSALGKAECPENSQIGGFDPKRIPVFEADLAEWGDLRDREIALRGLGRRRSGRIVVSVDFREGSGTNLPGSVDLIAHIAAYQGGYVGVGQRVWDVGVGNVILSSAQVHM